MHTGLADDICFSAISKPCKLFKYASPQLMCCVLCTGIYDPKFIAANQEERADNIIKGSRREQVETIQQHIQEFKQTKDVDKVVVLWTANTERYAAVQEGLNDTIESLMAAVDKDEAEISPSTLYAIACINEGVPFINGSPQNTFVPGLIDYAVQKASASTRKFQL